MSWDLTTACFWLLRAAVGGTVVLALASGAMFLAWQPARRQHIGEWGIIAALLVAILSLRPAWLSIPLDTQLFASLRAHAAAASAPSSREVTEIQLNAIPEKVASCQTWVEAGDIDESSAPTASLAPVEGCLLLDSRHSEINSSTNLEKQCADPELPSLQARVARFFTQAGSSLQGIGRWGFFGYVVFACLLLVRWLLAHLCLWRLLRAGVAAPVTVRQLFGEMAAQPVDRPRLLVSGRIRVPLSCGIFRPTIVIPADLCRSENAAHLRWVFLHELTHLERRDARTSLLFGLAQTLYFFCPLFWWLRRQVRLCQEYIADAAVSAVATPEDYAQYLIMLANAPGAPVAAAGITGKPSDLFRRIAMLLENSAPVERRCPRAWSWTAAAALVALASVASGVGLTAQAREEPQDRAAALADAPQDQAQQKDIDVIVELDELLHDVSPDKASSDDKIKEIREAQKKLEQASEQLRKALRELQQLDSGPTIVDPLTSNLGQNLIRLQPGRLVLQPGRAGESRLGVRVEKPSVALADQLDLPQGRGIVIVRVEPKSAADKAGVKANDILLELDGKPVTHDASELMKVIREVKADSPVVVVVLRKGKKETLKELRLSDDRGEFRVKVQPLQALQSVRAGQSKPITVVGVDQLNERKSRGIGSGHATASVTIADPKGVFTTLFRNDDRFTARHQEGTLVITLTGKVKEKASISEIVVEDAGKTHKYDSIEEVPERYRDKVKNLADMSQGRNAHIEVHTR
jgi:beta-lactamase regulating signal transducer with metallopeptidase domain